MNKTGFKFVLAAFCTMACWAGFPLFAQERGSDAKPGKSDSKEDKGGAEELGPRAAIRVQNVHRLRQMMDEKIQLSGQQAAAINRIFDDYIGDIKESYKGNKRPSNPNHQNKVIPLTMAQLQREKQAAEAAGDKAKIDETNQAMSNLRREPQTPGENFSGLLAAKIRQELKPDQIPVFDKVVERWELIVPKGPRTGPVQRLRRALKDPEVGLSAEIQKEVDERLQEALKAARRGAESSEEKMEAEVNKAQEDIFVKLTPEQRKKVEANMRAFKDVERQYDDSKARAKETGVLKKKPAKPAKVEEQPSNGDATKPAEAKPAEAKP